MSGMDRPSRGGDRDADKPEPVRPDTVPGNETRAERPPGPVSKAAYARDALSRPPVLPDLPPAGYRPPAAETRGGVPVEPRARGGRAPEAAERRDILDGPTAQADYAAEVYARPINLRGHRAGRDTAARPDTPDPQPETSPRQPPGPHPARDSGTPGSVHGTREAPPPLPENRSSAAGEGTAPGEPARSARGEQQGGHTPNDGTSGKHTADNDKGGDHSGSGGNGTGGDRGGGSGDGGDSAGGDRGGGDDGGSGSDPPDGPGPRGPDSPGPDGPDAGGGPGGDETKPKQVLLRAHSEFQGESLDLLGDGKRWVPLETVQAWLAEQEKKRSGATGTGDLGALPQQRDYGDNTVGENPDVQLGDTRDRRTIGEQLGEEDSDPDKPRIQRMITKAYRELDDVNDGVKNQEQTVLNIFDRPQPTGQADACVPAPPPVKVAQEQHVGASPDSITQLAVVTTILGIEVSRWAGRKLNDMVRRHDASHG